MLEDFPVKFKHTETVVTPSNEKLFKIDKCKPLDKTRAEQFHTTVAKGLFLCKRARPDFQPTNAALCTRTKIQTRSRQDPVAAGADQDKIQKLTKKLSPTV